MRFSRQNQNLKLPEINLTPLLDVLTTILAFFIIVSATYTSRGALNLELPQDEAIETDPAPLIIELNKQDIFIADKSVSNEAVIPTIKEYLLAYPQGNVIVNADRHIEHGQVTEFIAKIRSSGITQIGLGIQEK
jgi:biopolymer transport protein ExbD